MRDLQTEFGGHKQMLEHARLTLLKLREETSIRGLIVGGEQSSTWDLLVGEERRRINLDMASATTFARQSVILAELKRDLEKMKLHAANVSNGGFVIYWREGKCGYVHVGNLSMKTFASRHGYLRVPQEDKWYVFRD
jgi:hypothetical protein